MPEQHRLLLVEDDIFLQEICTEKLKKAHYTVDTASDGETGLQKMRENTYDLILLDIMLPEMNGLDVLKTYNQENPNTANRAYVVMLTNLSEQEQIDQAMSLGAHDYLVKAYSSPKMITEKVKEILS